MFRSRGVVVVVTHVGCYCHHCCRCSVAAASVLTLCQCELEPAELRSSMSVVFDTPSWCDGALAITPPNEDDVHDEAVVLVGCLSVAVALLLSDDTVVRCLCCLAVGAEALAHDDAEVVNVDCCTDGVEALNQDDVEVVNVGCRTDGFVALTPDDVADR